MKRLFFNMVIVSTVIIATLNSCKKEDFRPANSTDRTTSTGLTTLTLTTHEWEKKADRVFVNTFTNAIPEVYASHLAKIYLVSNGKDVQINQAIQFMDGVLYAATTRTDVVVTYRGNLETVLYLNIKVVFE